MNKMTTQAIFDFITVVLSQAKVRVLGCGHNTTKRTAGRWFYLSAFVAILA